ncbi:amidase [Rhodococcus sp. ACT016]|uniref:amidase n=1 Tax=Rhodococcus sp. ACT016 TaxID=3134808 RepID=UPI003D281950
MTQLHELSAVELAETIRRREAPIPEVAQHFLDRAQLHDDVGAFTTVAPDQALDRARLAQEVLMSDVRDLPRLFGVPVSIKDLEATRGIRTTYGSVLYRDWIPDRDDEIVQVIRGAGLIDIGKTTVPEFGAACYTEPEVAPPARSPFDPTLSAAGSSGGAGASVGAALVPLAQGSDTAGSLRSPAAACGVVGLKPSRGLITVGPTANDGMGLTSKGPMARTVRDTAALLDVMASNVGAGTVHPSRTEGFETAVLQADSLPPQRIAVAPGSVSGGEVHPEVVAAILEVGTVLETLGHRVFERAQAVDLELTGAFTAMFSALAGTKPVSDGAEDRLRPIVRHLRGLARDTDAGEFAAKVGVVQARARHWAMAYADADFVVTSTVTTPPVRIGALRNDEDPAAELAAMTTFTGNTIIANATGFPSISLPLGWTPEGIPIGVMISARWGCDAALLAISAQLESAMPWVSRYTFR